MKIELDDETFKQVSEFSDWRLYVVANIQSSALAGVGTIEKPKDCIGEQRKWSPFNDLSPIVKSFIEMFLAECVKKSNPWECFSVDYQNATTNETLRFRIQSMGNFFACKKIPTQPTNLSSLNVTDAVKKLVLSPSLTNRGGFVLMVGDPGTGKSIFAAAAMRERLSLFGGYCLVLGDPPEQPLADNDGQLIGENGYVDTVDVSKIGYEQGLVHSLRSFPVGKNGSLFYGEVRSDSNAFDLINVANDGFVVFSTMHAMSPDAALDRIIALCVKSGIPVDLARNMLAQSLFGVTYHRANFNQFTVAPFQATDELRQRIREGHPMPFKSSSALSVVG